MCIAIKMWPPETQPRSWIWSRSNGHRAEDRRPGHDTIGLSRHCGVEVFVVVGIATGMEGAADCSPRGDSLEVSKNFAPTLLPDISAELRPLDADRQLIERGVRKDPNNMLRHRMKNLERLA